MKIVQKPVQLIKAAKYNPGNRIKPEGLVKLIASIKQHNIILPLVVDNRGNLIDGHRRLEAAKILKMPSVPTLQIKSTVKRDEAFEVINTNQRKLSNNDMIFIYVNGGKIPPKALRATKEIEVIVGRKALKNLATKYTTYKVLDYAKVVQRYCGATNMEFLRKSILWLAKNKAIFQVRRAMEHNTAKNIIIQAIEADKPLKINYSVS